MIDSPMDKQHYLKKLEDILDNTATFSVVEKINEFLNNFKKCNKCNKYIHEPKNKEKVWCVECLKLEIIRQSQERRK